MSRPELNKNALFHIWYVVVLPAKDAGEFSLFQGFSLNTFDVINTIQYICTLPASVDELFQTRDEAIGWRSSGLAGYSILLLDLEFLESFTEGPPLVYFISHAESRERVNAHLKKHFREGWLHLTTDETTSEVPNFWTFSRRDAYDWWRSTSERILAKKTKDAGVSGNSFRDFVEWPEATTPLKSRAHNITRPTETALESLHFSLGGRDPLACAIDDEYARALSQAADELSRLRGNAAARLSLVPGTPELILTVPSVYRRLTQAKLPRDVPASVRQAIRNVLRQKQYIAMRPSGQEASQMIQTGGALAVLRFRAEELGAYTAALSVTAASLFAPVLRCPPQIDRVRELLIRFAGTIRSRNPNEQRKNKLFRDIGVALRKALPQPLFDQIEKHQFGGIKLIGDTPLELLPISDLPLGLRATTSRMPALPGNLLMRHSLMRIPILFHPQELDPVLLVRAFSADDPLRDLIPQALRVFNSHAENKVTLKIVDVSTKEQFINAFNSFEGPLAIFDGHGSHDRTAPQGTITVGSVRFNPFELYGKIRVPPIMFLSACETHTLEGIESSVASSFLFMGSRSVLGTLVPIDGPSAAILIARFLFRFSNLLPHFKAIVPWSQVVSGMLRMSYVTDVLLKMQKLLQFDGDVYKTIHTQANIAINEFRANWFEQVLSSISKATSVSEEEVRETWLKECYFTETLRYVHLGQPEHLFFVPNPEPYASK